MLDITSTQLYILFLQRTVKAHLTKRYLPMGKPRQLHCFIYVLSGTCTLTLDDGTQFHTKDGDVVYLPKGQDYSLEVTGEHWHYIVCDFMFHTDAQCKSMHIHPKNPPSFERLFQKLATACSVTTPGNQLEAMAYLYQIYALITRNAQAQYVPGSAKARIESARIYIQSHLDEPDMQIAALAQQAEMSQSRFRALFQELYGIPPVKYIVQERIAYAQRLMELPELQMEDIALQSGFSSLPYFSTVFKNLRGTTPAAYRQKLRESP